MSDVNLARCSVRVDPKSEIGRRGWEAEQLRLMTKEVGKLEYKQTCA